MLTVADYYHTNLSWLVHVVLAEDAQWIWVAGAGMDEGHILHGRLLHLFWSQTPDRKMSELGCFNSATPQLHPPLTEIYTYLINFNKIMWKCNIDSGWDVRTLLDFQFTHSLWDLPCLQDQQMKDCVTGWGRLRHYHPTQVLSPPLWLIHLLTVYIQEYLSYFFEGETYPDLQSFTCSTRGFCMYHTNDGLILE